MEHTEKEVSASLVIPQQTAVESDDEVPAFNTNQRPSVLSAAVKNGDLNLVRQLLARGVDVNDRENGKRYAYQMSPLLYACLHNHTEIALELIKAGAKVNQQDLLGSYALWHAVAANNKTTVAALLAAGANINAKDYEVWEKYPECNTVLMCAAKALNDPEIFDMLIAANPDLNADNRFGETALIKAVRAGAITNAIKLIEAGANIELSDRFGWTPLMVAAVEGSKEMVKALCESGANINTQLVNKGPSFSRYYSHRST